MAWLINVYSYIYINCWNLRWSVISLQIEGCLRIHDDMNWTLVIVNHLKWLGSSEGHHSCIVLVVPGDQNPCNDDPISHDFLKECTVACLLALDWPYENIKCVWFLHMCNRTSAWTSHNLCEPIVVAHCCKDIMAGVQRMFDKWIHRGHRAIRDTSPLAESQCADHHGSQLHMSGPSVNTHGWTYRLSPSWFNLINLLVIKESKGTRSTWPIGHQRIYWSIVNICKWTHSWP